jgi:hypothetical protein
MLKKTLQLMVAGFAAFGGLTVPASAQTVCNAGGCECKFTWNNSNQECRDTVAPIATTARANKATGLSDGNSGPPNFTPRYTTAISLVVGVSSSNVPITSTGAFYPFECRAIDQTRNSLATSKSCLSTLGTPAKYRVLVG